MSVIAEACDAGTGDVVYEPLTITADFCEWNIFDGIVAVSNESQMLPLSPEKISTLSNVYIAKLGDIVVGMCAVTFVYNHNGETTKEIGAMVVLKDFRHLHIASNLLKMVLASVDKEGADSIAFCNDASLRIFIMNGFRIADWDDVPRMAISACIDCPNKDKINKSTMCCDTILIKKAS